MKYSHICSLNCCSMSRRDYIFVENNCKNLVCPVAGYPSCHLMGYYSPKGELKRKRPTVSSWLFISFLKSFSSVEGGSGIKQLLHVLLRPGNARHQWRPYSRYLRQLLPDGRCDPGHRHS